MKVKLQNGSTIIVPEDCKVQINGNEVTIEKVEYQNLKMVIY